MCVFVLGHLRSINEKLGLGVFIYIRWESEVTKLPLTKGQALNTSFWYLEYAAPLSLISSLSAQLPCEIGSSPNPTQNQPKTKSTQNQTQTQNQNQTENQLKIKLLTENP